MSSCGDEWKTQDGMTEYTISDDGYAKTDLPFNFTLYGTTFSNHAWFHSNGVVSFLGTSAPNAGHLCCQGVDLSNPNSYWGGDGSANVPRISHMIAALWTDLKDYNVDADGDGIDDTGFYTEKVDTNNDGNIDTMRFLWRNISEYSISENLNTFGVEITSANSIEMHYFDVNITNHAVTIGVTGDMKDNDNHEPEYYEFVYEERNLYNTTGFNLNNIQNITGATQDGIDTILTFNLGAACNVNPLISPSCNGYEEAYAELVYQQQCAANPLYDIGCSGYEQAYYDQQCSADPLYAETCPGYEEAYYTQQCSADPLYDIGCTGYADAYYNQQCEADALYDTGCSGYEQAFYTQQCSINPLYDSGCTGYETAYYDYQCSLDPLYDSGCNGYADAYFNQQCSLDPLYDTQCPGYATAYYNQQCELDPLYDSGCSGYEQAYYETYIRPTLEEQANEAAGVDTDGVDDTPSTVVITTEDFNEPQILDDPVIDSIVFDEPEVIPYEIETNQTTDFGNPPEDVAEIQPTQNEESTEVETTIDTLVVDDETEEGQEESIEVASIEEEREDERETESSSDVDESVDSSGDDESSDAGQESDRETEDGGDGGTESSESSRDAPTESEKKKSKKKKLKEIAAKKAAQLANRMSEAATLEAQQAVQLQILRLIGFNPDFSAYQNVSITQPQFYAEEQLPDAKIPNSRRGLRNGLAQQLLHEKMVDMQYE